MQLLVQGSLLCSSAARASVGRRGLQRLEGAECSAHRALVDPCSAYGRRQSADAATGVVYM